MKSPSSTLEVVPSVGTDPQWDLARSLLNSGRKTAIAIRTELERLRGLYLHAGQGARTDLRVRGDTKVAPEAGFQAAIERELGISASTAYRLMERTEHQARIEEVATSKVGTVLTWVDKGAEKKLEITPARQALARKAVASWALPQSPKPSRSWAGICGEGARVDDLGNGNTDRAAVDPGKQIRNAFRSLEKWLPLWEDLPLEDQVLLAKVARDARLPALFAVVEKSISALKGSRS